MEGWNGLNEGPQVVFINIGSRNENIIMKNHTSSLMYTVNRTRRVSQSHYHLPFKFQADVG